MLTLKRLAVYLITFIICAVLALSIGNWRKVDNYIVAYSNQVSKADSIVNKEIVEI